MGRTTEQEPDPELAALRENLGDLMRQHYVPATAGDSTEMLTSRHLFHQVEQHAPGLITANKFREVLLLLGFTEERVGDDFYWLVKQVPR